VLGYPKRCKLVEIIVEGYDEVNLLPTRYCLNIIMPQDKAIISHLVFHLCSCGPLAAICPSHPSDKWRLISPRTCICDQVCSVVVLCQICPILHHNEEQLVALLPLLVPCKLCPFPQQLHHLLVALTTFVIIGEPCIVGCSLE